MKNQIIIISFLCFCSILNSCTKDETKALNYVKSDVLPEMQIENYLITYKARNINDEFWNDVNLYLEEISYPIDNHRNGVNLPRDYCHYIEDYGFSVDYWTFGSRYGYDDSQKFLQHICDGVCKNIVRVTNDITTDYSLYKSDSLSDFEWSNILIRECVIIGQLYLRKWMEKNGITINEENWKKYQYGWRSKSDEEQNAFIESLFEHLISKARDAVKDKSYKLIDCQGVKKGENEYEVIYLLEPQLKIVFDVTKVGDTFSCDNINIEGSI